MRPPNALTYTDGWCRREKKGAYEADLIDIFSTSLLPAMDAAPNLVGTRAPCLHGTWPEHPSGEADTGSMSNQELQAEIRRLRHQLDINRVRTATLPGSALRDPCRR